MKTSNAGFFCVCSSARFKGSFTPECSGGTDRIKCRVSVHRNNVQSAESIHPPPVIVESWSHRRSESVSASIRYHILFARDQNCAVEKRCRLPCNQNRHHVSAICRELSTPPVFLGDCRYLKEENIEQRLLPDYSEQAVG